MAVSGKSGEAQDIVILQSGVSNVPCGPFIAHLILAGAWVLPPFLIIVSTIVSGIGYGAKGMLCGVGVCGALILSPRNYAIRGSLCAVLHAMAIGSGDRRALCGAICSTIFAVLNTCKSFKGSQAFYDFFTKTLNGSAYYERAELRGALDELTPGKNFFLLHPHGCLSAGWTWNVFWNEQFHARVGPTCFLIDGNLREKNPLFRLVCDFYAGANRRCGCADKKTIKKAMEKDESLAIIPGGFEDATLMKYGVERTAILKRKGLIKYCLEHGYKLVPMYSFGEAETMITFTPLLKFRLWLNKFGIPAVAFFGNPMCPMLPRRGVKLVTVVGCPLVLPTIAKPTEADVDEWHGKYVEALRATFDKHKSQVGKPDAKLEIW